MKDMANVIIRKVHDNKTFFSLRDEWNNLLAKSPANSYFLRWEWLWRWWGAYEDKGHGLCILLVHDGDELIGIAPFYVQEKTWKKIYPLRRLTFLGTKAGSVISQYMDLIYKQGTEETVVLEVIEYLAREDVFDDIMLQMVDTASRTLPLLQSSAKDLQLHYTVKPTAECGYTSLPSHFEDFLATLSNSMRHKIRSSMRKAEKYNGLSYRTTSDLPELKEDFDELVRLHQCRWTSRHLPGSFSENRFRSFQQEVQRDMLANGHLELSFLSVSGKNIAALYNIVYKNKVYFYQAGLDAFFDRRISPGVLLHSRSINAAIRNGLEEYDFMLLGELDEYKRKWSRSFRSLCEVYIARPGLMKLAVSLKNKARSIYTALNNN